MKYVLLLPALIALLALAAACGDDDDDDGGALEDIQDTATEAASAVAGLAPVRVDLDEQEGSGVSGNALLTPATDDRVRATFELDVSDSASETSFEAGIWEATCESISGAPEYSLGEAGDGMSTEAFDADLAELKDGDYVLALRSDDTVVACGKV